MEDEDEVRRKAYERYVARGGGEGSEMEDWLAAEREIREMRERTAGSSVGHGDEGERQASAPKQSRGRRSSAEAQQGEDGARARPARAPRSRSSSSTEEMRE